MLLLLDKSSEKKIKSQTASNERDLFWIQSFFPSYLCFQSFVLLYKNISPCSHLLIIISRFTSAPEPACHGSPTFNEHRSRKVGLFQRRAVALGPDWWCSGNTFGALLLLFHPDYITNNHVRAGTALVYFSESVVIAAFRSGFKTP